MSGKTKKATKSKFAGFTAPPREALDMRIKVDPKDLARVDDLMSSVLGACDSIEASAKQIVIAMESSQKRLNRRVRIIIQDAEGAQISGAVYDLKRSDVLEAFISGEEIRALISNGDCR